MLRHAQRVRFVAFVVLILPALVCQAQGSAQGSAQTPNQSPVQSPADSSAQNSSTTIAAAEPDSSVLVYPGLSEKINESLMTALSVHMEGIDVVIASASTGATTPAVKPGTRAVIGAGSAGCQQGAVHDGDMPVFCILLTEENFTQIKGRVDASQASRMSAIVMDQPLIRQSQVASGVYPALLSYTVLTQSTDHQREQRQEHGMERRTARQLLPESINTNEYRSDQPLASQLADSLSASDALIATAESDIYNRDTLRTVLLTAYGYGKPVVGFSQAYVRAGALITAFSTTDQIVRQLAEHVYPSRPDGSVAASTAELQDFAVASKSAPVSGPLPGTVIYPLYFSVVDNISIANSLGLIKMLEFNPGDTYTDKDFP